MPNIIDWPEMLLRLVLASLAGAALGLNRTRRGMTAGLRTTMLVSLTAAVSMIQVNLLLNTDGKPPGSLVTLDLMRLPLGILTGMGFIGAGAIIRERGRVSGLTTAATLWLVTTLGLCFGGGQHALGLCGTGFGLVILWLLKRFEAQLSQDRHGMLTVEVKADGPTEEELQQLLIARNVEIHDWSAKYRRRSDGASRWVIQCELRWPSPPGDNSSPPFVRELMGRPGVSRVEWKG